MENYYYLDDYTVYQEYKPQNKKKEKECVKSVCIPDFLSGEHIPKKSSDKIVILKEDSKEKNTITQKCNTKKYKKQRKNNIEKKKKLEMLIAKALGIILVLTNLWLCSNTNLFYDSATGINDSSGAIMLILIGFVLMFS